MEVDKQFSLTVPNFERLDNLIIYNFRLEDTIKNKAYLSSFRFKDLQEYYRHLSSCKYDIPEFPRTHFWRRTNRNPKLIEQRRRELELFFNDIINDPLIRGQKAIKTFVNACQKSTLRQHYYSLDRKSTTQRNKKQSKSLQKSKSIRIDYFKQISTIKLGK